MQGDFSRIYYFTIINAVFSGQQTGVFPLDYFLLPHLKHDSLRHRKNRKYMGFFFIRAY